MSELSKCPICDGRGFVKGNFYDVAGQTCSFGDYAKKQQSSTICMYCNGNGVVNVGYIKEKGDLKLKDKWIKIRCAESDREYIKQKAKEKDMSMSEYIRYLLENDK